MDGGYTPLSLQEECFNFKVFVNVSYMFVFLHAMVVISLQYHGKRKFYKTALTTNMCKYSSPAKQYISMM